MVIVEGALNALDVAIMVWALLIVYLLLPGVVGFVMAIVPALGWRDPTRILVLRGFGRDDASRVVELTGLYADGRTDGNRRDN